MSLNINWIDILTNFLNFTEQEIDEYKTKMSDYVEKHHRQDHSNFGITILGYNAGHHSQFELVIDNENKDLKVMTQRSFLPEINILFFKLKEREFESKSIIDSNSFEQYISDINTRVRFTLMITDGGVEFIQSDVF